MFGVDLPAYHGPIDLLLYLIRREELPLEEISRENHFAVFGVCFDNPRVRFG